MDWQVLILIALKKVGLNMDSTRKIRLEEKERPQAKDMELHEA